MPHGRQNGFIFLRIRPLPNCRSNAHEIHLHNIDALGQLRGCFHFWISLSVVCDPYTYLLRTACFRSRTAPKATELPPLGSPPSVGDPPSPLSVDDYQFVLHPDEELLDTLSRSSSGNLEALVSPHEAVAVYQAADGTTWVFDGTTVGKYNVGLEGILSGELAAEATDANTTTAPGDDPTAAVVAESISIISDTTTTVLPGVAAASSPLRGKNPLFHPRNPFLSMVLGGVPMNGLVHHPLYYPFVPALRGQDGYYAPQRVAEPPVDKSRAAPESASKLVFLRRKPSLVVSPTTTIEPDLDLHW